MHNVLTRYSKRKKSDVLICEEPGKTQQQFRDECDANLILKKYRKTGILPTQISHGEPRYGDVSNLPSFQEMQNFVIDASEEFMRIPAKIRRQFNNDPMAFADYIRDPDNYQACVKAGILIPQKQPEKQTEKQPEIPAKEPDPPATDQSHT